MNTNSVNKILVTGGCGFVGSALVERLLQYGSYPLLQVNKDCCEVTVVDNLTTGSIAKLPKGAKFVKCDVNNYADISEVMLATKFDYVFHYAAVVGVQRTQENPVSVLRDIEGFKNILSLCKNTGVKHIYFSSSSEVYGDSMQFPQNEHTTPINSRLPYAIVKNVGEAFLQSYAKEHGLRYNIFRFFNTYGPKQSADFVMSRFINQALHGKDITIYGDGSQSRTFCYIDDNVDACMKVFEASDIMYGEVTNIGNHIETSVKELAEIIIRLTGSKSKIVYMPPLKEGDMSRRLPDNTNMLKLLGRPLVTLEDGIGIVIDAIKGVKQTER